VNILVIDVGGTHIKVLATGQTEHREVASGKSMTAAEMVQAVKRLTADWSYGAISIGFPGPVVHGRILNEPHNLGPGWVGFDFERAFGKPVRLINDAAMQALGSYRGGSMLFLGLGAGLGSALIVDGVIEPLELAHLPYKDGYTFEDYVGLRGLERLGEAEWRKHVGDVVMRLTAALQADDLVIGGGNSHRLTDPLPAHARLGDNSNAFLGGFALWESQLQRPDAPASAQVVPPVRHEVVVLFDVDNTLLDNDRVIAELQRYLEREVGVAQARCYFEIFEELRSQEGYADYLGALQRYRVANPHERGLLAVSSFIVNYPFANRLFPGSLDVIEHLGKLGPSVILTDGDVVFQPRKIDCSGLFAAVSGRVIVCIHKELELDDVERRYPAEHYVLVDDKVRILSAVKERWGSRVTTVFPRQGHYALDPGIAKYPTPDISVDRIGDLLAYEPSAFLPAVRA
jgi:polyphosphate glucokinase